MFPLKLRSRGRQICLRTVLTFLQIVSYHVHITCLWPDCHIWRWSGWWRSEARKAAKRVTTVQECISTFVSEKPLDIFRETSGRIPAVFVRFSKRVLIQNMICSEPNQSINTGNLDLKKCKAATLLTCMLVVWLWTNALQPTLTSPEAPLVWQLAWRRLLLSWCRCLFQRLASGARGPCPAGPPEHRSTLTVWRRAVGSQTDADRQRPVSPSLTTTSWCRTATYTPCGRPEERLVGGRNQLVNQSANI